MLNFAEVKTFIAECDLETKTKTFKAMELKVKGIGMFNLQLCSI